MARLWRLKFFGLAVFWFVLAGLVLADGAATEPGADSATIETTDTWTEPYPGVRRLERIDPDGPLRVHVVSIDLTAPGLSLVVTRPDDRGIQTSTFAGKYNAVIAVNAGFFDVSNHDPIGLTMGEGEVWEDSRDRESYGYVAMGGDNRVVLSTPSELLDKPEEWMTHIVSGRPVLVDGGEIVVSRNGDDPPPRHPRTALGLSEDGETLILAVIDGRWPGESHGMTLEETAGLMLELGAHQALNLDGGGSTTLYIEAEGGVVNRPSDGEERHVSNHLGVRIEEAGSAADND